MEKLKQESVNLTEQNIDRIAALFPSAMTETRDAEGNLKKAINFDTLKQLLSEDVVDGDECYEFTWVGKKQSIIDGNRPIRKTLRPAPEESKNWDKTENLYIEGDNLEVLKLLQGSYLGGIKMIYFDPPYNTGNDFVYRDNFTAKKDEYEADLGLFDEDENRLFQNNESNGRFHSDWCSMMYPRLQLARNLLTDDGVIFISIDDNEVDNLRKICDEVFGEDNYCGTISRLMKSGGAKGKFFSPNVEFILVYAKNTSVVGNFKESISEEIVKKLYTSVENSGIKKGEKYRPFGLYQSSLSARPNQRYYIECPDGTYAIPPGETMPINKKDGEMIKPKESDGCWRWSRDRYLEEKAKGNIEFKNSNGVLIDSEGRPSKWNIYSKIWLNDRQEEGMVPVNLITKWENRLATKELSELEIPFDYAKPTSLIQYLINIVEETDNSIILDFFSGSATTAHAVMKLNAEDGGNRKFIMVQLPEPCDEKSEANKAGYKNICEIGKERIRRAGSQIVESLEQERNTLSKQLDKMLHAKPSFTASMFSIDEQKDMYKQAFEKEGQPILEKLQEIERKLKLLDTGFRVLKLDNTNMKDVYYGAGEYSQQMLLDLESNIKDDRTDLDLLYGVLLDWGVPLSLPHTTELIEGKRVHFVNDTDLVACFEESISETIVREIARRKPLRVVFRDSSFGSSPDKINVTEIFKTLSSETTVKVI
jgi:adenine-specific DNA-methyltransferase